MRATSLLRTLVVASLFFLPATSLSAAERVKGVQPPDGWTTAAPRDEIRPDFFYEPTGSPDGGGVFGIRADDREGLDGWWTKTFPIEGGRSYAFGAAYKATGVEVPRRSVVVKIR